MIFFFIMNVVLLLKNEIFFCLFKVEIYIQKYYGEMQD